MSKRLCVQPNHTWEMPQFSLAAMPAWWFTLWEENGEVMSSGPDWAWLTLVTVFHNSFAKHLRGVDLDSGELCCISGKGCKGEEVQLCVSRWAAEMNRRDLWTHWIYLFAVGLCRWLTCRLLHQLCVILSPLVKITLSNMWQRERLEQTEIYYIAP